MFVIVLNDGETFSELSGTRIIKVPEDVQPGDLDEWIKRAYENEYGESLETLVKKTLEKKL